MHIRGCPKSGQMKLTIDTTSYPANPHKVLVRVIQDALSRGRRKGGMSKKSIQTRIAQTYHCKLGARFEKELTKSLKRLVRSCDLEKTGYRYKLCKKSAASRRGWGLYEALPLTCRCRRPSRSRSSSRCSRRRQPSSQRWSRTSGIATASRSRRPARCGCRSRSSSRTTARWKRSTSAGSRTRGPVSGRRRRGTSRTRSRGGGTSRTRSRGGGTSRTRSTGGGRRRRKRVRSTSSRSRTRSRLRSRSCSRSQSRTRYVRQARVSGRRTTSRSRGRSRTRRSRTTYSSRSQTRSISRKRRRIRYVWKIQTRSASRSTNGDGARSPTPPPQLLVPEPKIDAKRGIFEPGLFPATKNTPTSTSHSGRRATHHPHGPAPSTMARGRAQSPARRCDYHHRSSVTARSRSRRSSARPVRRSRYSYLPVMKPMKPALRQSAPQCPSAQGALTPRSMVKLHNNNFA